MSGFEAAGIVLGTIPLVISALEHYHDGISAVRRWRRYQREHQHLARILKTEEVKLQNICEELLKGLVPASRIEIMIKDPFGPQWHDGQLDSKLKLRLHDSIDVFQTIIIDVRASMLELMRRLGIDPENKDNEEPITFFRRELQRAVFTISRSTYSDLTDSIRSSICDLETLTNQNVSLEPQRQKLSQVRLLTLLRELSYGLYRALEGSLSCACAHTLSLKLAARPAEIMYANTEFEMLDQLDLHLLLSSKKSVETEEIQEAELWRGLRFCSTPMVPPEKAGHCFIGVSSQPKRKRVAFQSISSVTEHGSSVATVTQIATSQAVCLTVPIHSTNAMEPPRTISNLCSETVGSHSKQPHECFGATTAGGHHLKQLPAAIRHAMALSQLLLRRHHVLPARRRLLLR
ncbi:hypothetical protein NLG97_g4940 [Lecanicillium saksenae]|uniref:Uncharacterized protein n=1 Tax=Lecanicillium saksenae TaxID=468837 RepID=A0ACC1QUF2_9HYPO|nr:hypothetical protein NLG97_g4940 [Lecanicillium saksenae]